MFAVDSSNVLLVSEPALLGDFLLQPDTFPLSLFLLDVFETNVSRFAFNNCFHGNL